MKQSDLERIQELKKKKEKHLSSTEKQELYIANMYMTPMPCPLCDHQFGYLENEVNCPNCGIELRRVIPVIAMCGPSWYWTFTKDSKKKILGLWNKYVAKLIGLPEES